MMVIAEEKSKSLFRSMRGRKRELTSGSLSRFDAYKIIQRRAEDAGISSEIACYTFRVTGITEYLRNGGTS
jgi:site-specific recombinase XerD